MSGFAVKFAYAGSLEYARAATTDMNVWTNKIINSIRTHRPSQFIRSIVQSTVVKVVIYTFAWSPLSAYSSSTIEQISLAFPLQPHAPFSISSLPHPFYSPPTFPKNTSNPNPASHRTPPPSTPTVVIRPAARHSRSALGGSSHRTARRNVITRGAVGL